MSSWLAKAQLDKITRVQPARKVNVEENVDSYDGDEEEETGDDGGGYDNDHADDEGDDSNNGSDEKEYDGSSKDYDVVLQEIGSSSEEED